MVDCERDYAERTSEEIVNLMQRSCTPRGEALDVKWFESVLARVAGIVVDGALQKKRGGGQQQFRGDGQSAGCISCSGMVERATDASVRRRVRRLRSRWRHAVRSAIRRPTFASRPRRGLAVLNLGRSVLRRPTFGGAIVPVLRRPTFGPAALCFPRRLEERETGRA